MDADIKQVIILIHQPDGLLLPAIVHNLLEPIEPAHSMINMAYKISLFQIIQITDSKGFFPAIALTQPEPVITLKDLVISIACQLCPVINKAFMQGYVHGIKGRSFFHFLPERHILKNSIQPFQLLWIAGQDQVLVVVSGIFFKTAGQKVKILIEGGLWFNICFKADGICRPWFFRELDQGKVTQS